MQKIDVPRFDFIELSEENNSKRTEHTYFVTTDVNAAVDHYLRRIQEHKLTCMTISSIDGTVCFAKSYGLSNDHVKPKIIRVNANPYLKATDFNSYTEDFIKTVEKRLI